MANPIFIKEIGDSINCYIKGPKESIHVFSKDNIINTAIIKDIDSQLNGKAIIQQEVISLNVALDLAVNYLFLKINNK